VLFRFNSSPTVVVEATSVYDAMMMRDEVWTNFVTHHLCSCSEEMSRNYFDDPAEELDAQYAFFQGWNDTANWTRCGSISVS